MNCRKAPEAVEVPRSLLRADGYSICQRHGGVRYATRARLVMDERLAAQTWANSSTVSRSPWHSDALWMVNSDAKFGELAWIAGKGHAPDGKSWLRRL